MIIVGYPAIGKTTLARTNINYIDLESSNFFVDGEKIKHWYKFYCSIAEDLSRQGYRVFVSSHKDVRNWLKGSYEKVVYCLPFIDLKDKWIKKTYDRYLSSGYDKDYRAYKNIEENYDYQIKEMSREAPNIAWIMNIDYKLEDILKGIK